MFTGKQRQQLVTLLTAEVYKTSDGSNLPSASIRAEFKMASYAHIEVLRSVHTLLFCALCSERT